MINRVRTCCLSGHRVIPIAEKEALSVQLTDAVSALIEQGYDTFLIGGALGFDTMGGMQILSLKKQHPQLRLILVQPCATQTAGWSRANVEAYETVRGGCDECICLSDRYYHGCMQVRNRYLVDHSSVCLCYLNDLRSGTAYTVNYADEQGLQIINLAE